MKVRVLFFLIAIFSGILSANADARTCTTEATIEGAISTATYDFVERAIKRTERESCSSLLLHVNTPGGSLQTTRMIVENILSSSVPILCLVGPEGGHAGSAGALILLACHVSGVLPATNIGAATPIAGGGMKLGDDLRAKIVEDTKSWAVALAKKRGRSTEFAEKIVTDAKAYDAEAALKAGGVDILATSTGDFLRQAGGREVLMVAGLEADSSSGAGRAIKVETGQLVSIERDWRERVLSVITDPEFSYLIFMAALGLLYFEFTHPGAIVPGVAGALMLVTSLIAFQKLDVSWGGVGLIVLGVIFLIAEAFVPSFGALGVGGVLALGLGSVLLYDPASGGLSLSPWLSLGAPLLMGLTLLAFAVWIFRTRRRGSASRAEGGVLGETAKVERMGANEFSGSLVVRGEIWMFESAVPIRLGDEVKIVAIDGLTLKVQKIQES